MYSDLKPPVYGRFYDFLLHGPQCFVPEVDRLDQAALSVHLDRLAHGCVLRIGYPIAIYDRHKHPLDPNDITAVTRKQRGRIYIPLPFASLYFGEGLDADTDGYIDLNAVCSDRELPMYVDAETGLVCVTPPRIKPVTREEDPAFLARMSFVFEDPRLPMPRCNCSQYSRTVVAFEGGFPEGETDWLEKEYVNLYSPSLLIRYEGGKKVLYVSHENARGVRWEELETETVLRRSEDDGKTWTLVATWKNARWCYLFEVRGRIYLCGSRLHPSHAVMIARVDEDGLHECIISENRNYTNPNAVVVANERIYLPTFPCMMSAKLDSELLDPASWSFSNSLNDCIDKNWFLSRSGCPDVKEYWQLEGNIVRSPDGSLHNMMRLEIFPYNGYAGLIDISEDGKIQTRNSSCDGLVEMPTAVSKFCVRYDESTGLYLAMTAYPTLPDPVPCPGPPMAGQRNVLAFAASSDMIHWKTLDILLCDTEVMNAFCSARAHAFQYVVWDFDGEDLVYVVREACGYTKHYHDGTYVTMYRLKNYRKLLAEHYGEAPFFTKNKKSKKDIT